MGNYKYSKKNKKDRYTSLSSMYINSLETGLIQPGSSLLHPEDEVYPTPELIEETKTNSELIHANALINQPRLKIRQVSLMIPRKWPGLKRNSFKLHRDLEVAKLAQITKNNIANQEERLLDASNKGNYTLVKRILSGGWVNPSCQDSYGRTPLHFASSKGYCAIIDALLEVGARVDITDNNGNSPLDLAAISNHLEAVKRLTKAGAKVHDYLGGENIPNGVSRIGHLRNPLRMIKARLHAYKSTSTPIDPSLQEAMLQILQILRQHLFTGPTTSGSTRNETNDIDDLCSSLEESLKFGDSEIDNHKVNSNQVNSNEENSRQQMPASDAFDQLSLLLEKLNI